MASAHSTLNCDPVVDPRPELPADDWAADSLVEAFEAVDGDFADLTFDECVGWIELTEPED